MIPVLPCGSFSDDGVRSCVVVAGAIPRDDPRTPIDAIEARAEVQE
jgi:hypothetical protein